MFFNSLIQGRATTKIIGGATLFFWRVKKLEGHIRRAKRGVFEGAKRPRKKGGSGGPPPENLYNWYANGANLGISGKFDLLFHSLAVAYFRAHKNKIE